MLVRPFSDLHVEFWQPNKIPRILEMVIPPLPTDKETVALVAGDIGLAHRQETWLKVISLLAKQFLAVIYVEGNHFFYHNDFFGRIQELKAKVSLPKNVHFLENESVEINGVLFVGAMFWTDFLGKDFFKMQYARTHMNDFFVIKKADGKHLIPEETVDLFEQSKRFIFDTLVAAGDRKRVVVTHHGVSSLSIHDQFRGDSLNCAFMTDISNEIIDHGPDLWVHGHTHNSFDYTLGKTRVVVNPYGYKDVAVNPQYDKQLIIEI
jgi:Icc-related predicted phosphoesterase